MPQMSPMNWVFLFILFNTCAMMTGCKLHFFYKEKHLKEASEGLILEKKTITQIK